MICFPVRSGRKFRHTQAMKSNVIHSDAQPFPGWVIGLFISVL